MGPAWRQNLGLVVIFGLVAFVLFQLARGPSKLHERCHANEAGSCREGLACVPQDPSCRFARGCYGTCATVCSSDADCTAPLHCGSFQSVREHVCR